MKVEHRAGGLDVDEVLANLTTEQKMVVNNAIAAWRAANPRRKLVLEWDLLKPLLEAACAS